MFRLQLSAAWPEDRAQLFAMPELRGSTLGIVGYGAIGRELAGEQLINQVNWARGY